MIRLQDVHKSFGAVEAVRGVSLEIPSGQVVGVLGPNGAGKTTTVRMITGILPPSRGSVTVAGLDSVADSIRVRGQLGYLPESAPLYREMRAGDYLHYRARLYGMDRRARQMAVARCADLCHLADVLRRRIGQLSKGYRQRVGLASVLVHDPKVLILDEPTSGLDPAQIAETRRLIRDLAGDRTMLIVSHVLPEVERSCDRIILLARGRIQADGTPEALVKALPGAGRYTLETRSDASNPGLNAPLSPEQVLRTIPGVESVDVSSTPDGWRRCLIGFAPDAPDQREKLARACAQAGLIVRELRPQAASLEDVYLRVVAYAADAHPTAPGAAA